MGNLRSDPSFFQLIDRKQFDLLVERHGMDKGVRNFTTWEMTCALLTCLTLRLSSYREVEETLGIPRSTFGDAMGGRFHVFFQDLCDLILLDIRGRTQDRKIRRGIRELLAIDSSECRVHGSMFTQAGWQPPHTISHQAACKIHVVFNVNGEWIEDFKITGVRRNDAAVVKRFSILPGKTYVFDRAYCDMGFWLDIMDSGSHFVTRLKECTRTRELQAKVLKEKGDKNGVLWDGFHVPGLLASYVHKKRLEVTQIRHIIYRDPISKKIFHFVTSDLKASANTIASIYKSRWAVELLFRWLKGHLDIRYLATKNTNAVKIQLTVAVLIQLLLQLKKITMRFNGTLWEMLRKIRASIHRQTLAESAPPDGCRWRAAPVMPGQPSCL